jgi:hypothetical protein
MSRIFAECGALGGVVAVLLSAAACGGCAGSSPEAQIAASSPPPRAADERPTMDYGSAPARQARPEPEAVAPSPRGATGGAAAKSRGDYDERGPQESAPAPGAYHRPGLGTEWGERRVSHTTETSFERQRFDSPYAQVAIRYDDEDGVRALTGLDDRYAYPGVFALAGGTLTVSLTESDGDPWPALTAGGKHFVIGDEGDRYTIRVTNHSPGRFEVVASVDGLDVIDGQDAEYGKRGYVIAPWGSLDIDGFRSSTESVHAFRFGEIEDSYAVARGRGADIGVVGVAIFEERGYSVDTRRWNAGYHEPEPFPGRFAPPPGY